MRTTWLLLVLLVTMNGCKSVQTSLVLSFQQDWKPQGEIAGVTWTITTNGGDSVKITSK